MTVERLRLLTRTVCHLISRDLTDRLVHTRDAETVARHRAVAVREAFERLGPLYMKVGQILSTRPDIVPSMIADELGRLHDRVQVMPFSAMEPVLVQDLGPAWRANFSHVNVIRPLGTASLAQVYSGRLRNGKQVVLKVQRPGLAPIMDADMRMLKRATKYVGRCAPRLNATVDLHAMLSIVFDAIRPELDFRLEAQNMDTARQLAHGSGPLMIPDVLHATEHVMVQSFAPGTNIRDADPTDFKDGDRETIGRALLAFMLRGYFEHRFFHADPHPGNILVHPEYGASVIDWGSIGRIDRRTSLHLLSTLLGVAENDGHSAARAWIGMGSATPWADISGFVADCSLITPKLAAATMEELNFGSLFATVLQRSTKRGIRSSPIVSVLGKSFANIDGSVRCLSPEISVIDVFVETLDQIVCFLVKESTSDIQLIRLLMETLTASHSFPASFNDIVRDLANKETTFQFIPRERGATPAGERLRKLTPLALVYLLWRTRRVSEG